MATSQNGEKAVGHWLLGNLPWVVGMALTVIGGAIGYGAAQASNAGTHALLVREDQALTARVGRCEKALEEESRWRLDVSTRLGEIGAALGVEHKGK